MTADRSPDAVLQRLCAALDQEIRAYLGLLQAVTRQNRFLRGHDVASLHAVADEWAGLQAEADGVRHRRIEAQETAARVLGLPADAALGAIAARPADGAEEVGRLRSVLRRTLEALERQNALNGRLARFCLDLVAGEAEAVSRGLRAAGGGTYDDKGAMTAAGGGGVITRQA